MTGILNEFLSVEKLEQGLEQCDPEDLDLVDLCADLVEELRSMCKTGQDITYGNEGSERQVCLDRQMLSNILRNLLSNAIKYSPEGARIDLWTSIEHDRMLMKVSDHGIGVPIDDQPYLFGRFFRASNAGTVQGTGLGLHIVGRYIELMRGSITFASEPRLGTTFNIALPRRLQP